MSGDHPVTPIFSQPVDVVSWLRCEADAAAREPAPWEMLSKAASEIERLRVIVQGWEHSARNAERDMATLRAERDEARRMVCGLDADIMEDQIEYAKHRGWDCFKENGNA